MKRRALGKWVLIGFCVGLLSCSGAPRTKSADHSLDEEFSSQELPTLVISFNLFAERYQDFKSLESNPRNPLILLWKNLEALPGGIPTGLAFVHRAFIVQNEFAGSTSGLVRQPEERPEGSSIPYESLLFVTTPIASLENQVLAIVSEVSPERTLIFSIDRHLNTALHYDSFEKNEIKNKMRIKGAEVIGSIYQIHVKKPGYYILEERTRPGERGLKRPAKNRTFVVDVTKGKFELLPED